MTLKLQLFREGLSEKVHATNPKGIVGGFEFTVLQRNLKELARKAMKMCLRVLTERNKVGSTATVVRNSISIISHITFRDCRVHIFSDNLFEIAVYNCHTALWKIFINEPLPQCTVSFKCCII